MVVFLVAAIDYPLVEPNDILENESSNCLISRDWRYGIFLAFSIVKVFAWIACVKLLIY